MQSLCGAYMNTLMHNHRMYQLTNHLHRNVKPNTYSHEDQKPTVYGQILHASLAVGMTYTIFYFLKKGLKTFKKHKKHDDE